MQLTITNPQHIHFFCIYRPPPSSKNGLKNSMFINELPELLDYVNTLKGKTIILGDINVPYNNPQDWLTKQIIDITTT